MNSENSNSSEPYVLILEVTIKLDLRRAEKSITLSNCSIYYTWNMTKKLSSNME